MKTNIYLVRHSKPLKERDWYLTNESLQVQNEKDILSIEGEQIACEHFTNKEFKNIDSVYSSNYTRAISTAKYVANNNNLKIKIVDDLGERKQGVNSWNEYPSDFEIRQFNEENYKIGNGESQSEVRIRMYNALMKIIGENSGKKIVVVTHSTAMMFLLKNWCDIEYGGNYIYNGNVFFNGKWSYLETFKLEFEDNMLTNITNISISFNKAN